MTITATAQSHPNIAFIKYWGNRDNALRLPSNGSISMNLDGLFTRTTITLDAFLSSDELTINGKPAGGAVLGRVSQILNEVRMMSHMNHFAHVESENNFPSGAGIASSASAFAALALAASKAAGLDLSERELSILARHGSGSASRSIPGGFVEWKKGTNDRDSFASSIAPADHWPLMDCIAVVNAANKETGSTEGHALAPTSPLQAARLADAPRRLDLCRRAILESNFSALASIVELDSDMMHAVMMTSSPALHYWQAPSVAVIESVRRWRKDGASAFYTVDAGPNVHVLCPEKEADEIASRLCKIDGVKDVIKAHAGGPAKLVS